MFNAKQPSGGWQNNRQDGNLMESVQRIAYNTFWIATLIVGLSLVLCKLCLMLLS